MVQDFVMNTVGILTILPIVMAWWTIIAVFTAWCVTFKATFKNDNQKPNGSQP